MQRFYCYVLFLVSLVLTTALWAAPQALSSEGVRASSPINPPPGCRVIYGYVDDPKCVGGRCYIPYYDCCGNGEVDADSYRLNGDTAVNRQEECDLGPQNGQDGSSCTAECQLQVVCGDGREHEPEECDLGPANGAVGSTCNAVCELVDGCGRGTEDPNYGQADCCIDVLPPVDDSQFLRGTDEGGGYACVRSNLMAPYLSQLSWMWDDPQYGLFYNYWTYAEDGTITITGQNLVDPITQRAIEILGQRRREYLEKTGLPTNGWMGMWTLHPDITSVQTSKEALCWTCAVIRWHGCYVPETKLKMHDGTEKEIQDLRAGDLLLNPVTGKAQEVKTIIESYEKEAIIELVAGENTIRVTQGHPIFNGIKFIKASEVEVGMEVMLADNKLVKISKKTELPVDPTQRVINFTLKTDSSKPEDRMVLAEGFQSADLLVQQGLAKE